MGVALGETPLSVWSHAVTTTLLLLPPEALWVCFFLDSVFFFSFFKIYFYFATASMEKKGKHGTNIIYVTIFRQHLDKLKR